MCMNDFFGREISVQSKKFEIPENNACIFKQFDVYL